MKDESSQLAKKISAAQRKLTEADNAKAAPPGASRYSIELVSGAAVGGVLGWGADMLFGTKPWFFIAFLLLGICGGFWNIIKLARQQDLGHIDADSQQ